MVCKCSICIHCLLWFNSSTCTGHQTQNPVIVCSLILCFICLCSTPSSPNIFKSMCDQALMEPHCCNLNKSNASSPIQSLHTRSPLIAVTPFNASSFNLSEPLTNLVKNFKGTSVNRAQEARLCHSPRWWARQLSMITSKLGWSMRQADKHVVPPWCGSPGSMEQRPLQNNLIDSIQRISTLLLSHHGHCSLARSSMIRWPHQCGTWFHDWLEMGSSSWQMRRLALLRGHVSLMVMPSSLSLHAARLHKSNFNVCF